MKVGYNNKTDVLQTQITVYKIISNGKSKWLQRGF